MIDPASLLGESCDRILVTGGAGFIGGALVRRLLRYSNAKVLNLDKCGYASDQKSIEQLLMMPELSCRARYEFLPVDLFDIDATNKAIERANPDLVFHLAAESHVDRSIDTPNVFLESNVIGTFNLLQAVRNHWESLPDDRQSRFRFHHISTDEVFGSLDSSGRFNESTSYDPRSPYSASKAASDHLVNAWHHTYGLPVILTNCSNNYGPWQFPEKLIPVVILKAIAGEEIPLYGDGENVRDWLYVEDHIDALLLAALKGDLGRSYCVGGYGERTNEQVVQEICKILDKKKPKTSPYFKQVKKVRDRPGHDRRYSIDATRISNELGWHPSFDFQKGLSITVDWYLSNLDWCIQVCKTSGYSGERIGNSPRKHI